MSRGRFSRGVWCIGAVLCCLVLPVKPARCAVPRRAVLYLGVDPRGSARVQLWLNFAPPPDIPWEEVLQQTLGAALQEVEGAPDDDGWRLRARCATAFQRRGLLVEGRVSPAPLMGRLRPFGVQWLTLNIRHSRAGYSYCPGATEYEVARRPVTAYYHHFAIGFEARPLRLEFGYRAQDLLWAMAPPVLLLLLPVLLTLRLHGTAARIEEADPAIVWFGYWRWRRWLSTGTLWGWLTALWLLPVWQMVRFELQVLHPWMAVVPILEGIGLVPPLLVSTLCGLSLYPLVSRVKPTEWTLADVARQSAWSLAASLAPLLLAGAALGAVLDDDPRMAVLWFLMAVVSWSTLLRLWMQSLDLRLKALTVGDLRDRLFALAEKAGVKVHQLYVLPAGKSRMANAFAMRGNNVLLTDYLLQHLDRREVDGIIAHELSHLKRGDPRRLGRVLGLSIVLPAMVYCLLGSLGDPDAWRPILPLLLAVGLMINYFVRRRLERGADAGAVALTGDPEAVIRGLVRITRLNQMPLQWGKWDERVLTHPSTLRRVQAIAKQNGLPPERLEELLRSPESDEERYSLPPSVAGEERVFSTSYKSQILTRIRWTLIGVLVLTPAVAAKLAALAPAEGIAKIAVYLAGLALTPALYLIATNFLSSHASAGLERRLRAKLENQGIDSGAGKGQFVGFSPAAVPRIYEGFYDWDLGLLLAAGDRLYYAGEQTQFALRREQVTEIRLGRGGPGWGSAPTVYITWRDEARSAGSTFNLRPADARSLRQLRREVRALAKRLQSWRDEPPTPAALPPPLAALEAPSLGEVTSAPVRTVLNGRGFLRALMLLIALAAGACLLLDFPFDPEQGGAAWYVIGVTAVAVVFQWWPYLVYREPAG